NTGYFPTESLEPSGNRLFSRSALNEGDLFRGSLKDASLHYNSQKLELTKNEFRILQLLFERRGRTVPREDIMQALWESDSFIDDNTLTVNVARLRAHLAEIGLEGLIRTQKGLGYLVDET
ncbi:winged helix-turn-helix domain-containing protein, partial [Ruthenibacterium lactatiformans]|uniref:winged helix-turn-helix domain-containing protein n=1 Tax=Ruthenibacterium lactatiformans TaxID=1550024 RepID=UPI001FC8A31F